MGITASLFHSSNDPDKQTLHRRVKPSQEQMDEQKERWNDLAEYLVPDLQDRSGYPVRTWLQGSYKFGTQVRPSRLGEEYDIDLGVYFCWEGEPEDGEHRPDELKDMVQKSLEAYESEEVEEVVAPPKSRCSRIRYEGGFHIDVPSYHLDVDRDARMLATESDGWEDSDPKTLYTWFTGYFDDFERERARRLIRYMKCWAALNFTDGDDRPSSVLLTVLVAEALRGLPSSVIASDDDCLLAVLDSLVRRLEANSEVLNPANKDEDLADRMSYWAFNAFLDKLRSFREIAAQALVCEAVVDAAEKWAEVFEHFFPMPDVEEITRAVILNKHLPVVTALPEISVRAWAKNNPGYKYSGTNRIGPIRMDCEIEFQVTNSSDFPLWTDFQWTVRNEGDDAEYINDLGHKAGDGLFAKEHSAYNGTHYMDCVAKHHGRVIGYRRVQVEISGPPIPRRNPAKRPAYTALNKRRRG